MDNMCSTCAWLIYDEDYEDNVYDEDNRIDDEDDPGDGDND